VRVTSTSQILKLFAKRFGPKAELRCKDKVSIRLSSVSVTFVLLEIFPKLIVKQSE
jgi:hypothetical protein